MLQLRQAGSHLQGLPRAGELSWRGAGGTADARCIKDHCPVCEYGMTNQTAHKADENALVSNIRLLSDIYQSVLDGFFADPG